MGYNFCLNILNDYLKINLKINRRLDTNILVYNQNCGLVLFMKRVRLHRGNDLKLVMYSNKPSEAGRFFLKNNKLNITMRLIDECQKNSPGFWHDDKELVTLKVNKKNISLSMKYKDFYLSKGFIENALSSMILLSN